MMLVVCFLFVCVCNSFFCFLFFPLLKHIFLKTSPGSSAGKDDENHKEEWSRNLQIRILERTMTGIVKYNLSIYLSIKAPSCSRRVPFLATCV